MQNKVARLETVNEKLKFHIVEKVSGIKIVPTRAQHC